MDVIALNFGNLSFCDVVMCFDSRSFKVYSGVFFLL